MPDRIIRDEILLSDRWIDLPTDSHRLIYAALLLRADDYGNLEGGPRRLYRWMHGFSQIKSEADSIKLMSDLQDAEMVMRYTVSDKEYWHIMRFKNSRWYWKRECPQSPYPDDTTNEEKQRPKENRNTHVSNTLPTRREGVGVGVGEGLENKKNKTTARAAPFVLPDWVPKPQWEAWLEARSKARKPATEWAKKLAIRRLEEHRDNGHSPALVLAESAFNNWSGLYEPRSKK